MAKQFEIKIINSYNFIWGVANYYLIYFFIEKFQYILIGFIVPRIIVKIQFIFEIEFNTIALLVSALDLMINQESADSFFCINFVYIFWIIYQVQNKVYYFLWLLSISQKSFQIQLIFSKIIFKDRGYYSQ